MPSKKIIYIFIACVIVVIFIFFAVGAPSLGKEGTYVAKPEESTQLLVEKVVEQSANKDDDNDGLKNWEEGLWHTDPNKADTDGNGISDGEQVKKQIENSNGAAGSGQTANSLDNSNQTKTDEFSKKFFAEYLTLKKAGDIDANAMQKLITNSISQVDTTTHNTYTKKDIKTVPDTNIALARTYGNSLTIIREKYAAEYKKNPLGADSTGLSAKSFSESQEFVSSLTKISALFKNMALDIKNLPVPLGLAETHLALINNYMTSSQSFKDLSDFKNDPVLALTGIQKYTVANKEEGDLLTDVAYYFLKNGIIFSEDEPGFRIRGI